MDHKLPFVLTALALLPVLSGCGNLRRLAEVGEAPPLTQIKNPQSNPNYAQVTMPMPRPKEIEQKQNSLWNAGARSFFKDQRAQEVGDILTIKINFSEKADISNATKRARTTKEGISVNTLMGFETKFKEIFPDAVNPAKFIDYTSNPSHDGSGSVKRSESLNAQVAATIIQILPNGNMVVSGRQEIRVNAEIRELLVAGIVRPQDILSDNSVTYDKIAEARISYGGRGQISDLQQPPWGQQVLDLITPF